MAVVQPRYYEIVWCPHPEINGIKQGNRFLISEVNAGLKLGIWPLGMIVRNSQSRAIRIVCGDGKAYRDPQSILPPQKLNKGNGKVRE